ncbi:MAG: alpha/beta fold hydrolase [Chloroflexota bacterium]
MSVWTRNNIQVSGAGSTPMVLAHGYGCDQNVWRFITPAFEERYKLILFDHVGAGQSDLSAYSFEKYTTLRAYADDLLEICAELKVQNGIFVGHSVSAMIGVLAAIQTPQHFQKLVLIGPSPRYVNDPQYIGGFSREDIDGLLELLDSNHLGWAATMAPAIMGNPERPELGEELANSFCRTDPEIARQFARVTFLSDNRTDLPLLTIPSLILQCADDVCAPRAVGEYLHRELRASEIVFLHARGHCPHLSEPAEMVEAMCAFLDR